MKKSNTDLVEPLIKQVSIDNLLKQYLDLGQGSGVSDSRLYNEVPPPRVVPVVDINRATEIPLAVMEKR